MDKVLYLLGDVHGEFGQLNSVMNKLCQRDKDKEVIFVVLGDFAYFWPRPAFGKDKKGEFLEIIQTPEPNTIKIPKNGKLYWLPGNHENWNELSKYAPGKIHELGPRHYYAARFSVCELPYLGHVLFIGGADSIDKDYRIEGQSWWANEIITHKDMEFFFENPPGKIDTVLSHTCPTYFTLKGINKSYEESKGVDPTKKALDIVFDKCQPTRWFFGHYHMLMIGKYKNCYWKCLNIFKYSNGTLKIEE